MNDRDEKYSKYINFEICPETGLMKQGFSCAECHSDITQSNSRLCDYDGMYYCYKCHWNDLEPTPARVLHNWDFDARPVSRRSLQILTYLKRKPVLFNLLEFNTMLYGLVDELNLIKVNGSKHFIYSYVIRLFAAPSSRAGLNVSICKTLPSTL